MTLIRSLFTGRDNTTYDLGRVLWAKGGLAYILMTAYALSKGQQFDPVAWGAGFGAVMAGGGGAIWAKRSTEPDPTP